MFGLAGALELAAVAGCDGGAPAIPFSQFEPNALAAVCRLAVLCRSYPAQATCLTSEQTQPHYYDTLSQDIASGKVIYDGVSARACIDALNSVSSCSRNLLATSGLTPVCNKIFTGTVAAGGACFVSEECLGDASCLATASCSSGQCCAGTCQASSVTVPLGADCSGVGKVCVAGTVCVSDSTTGASTCRQPVAAGGECHDSRACAAGLYCDLTSGICKALLATGAACDPSLNSADCENDYDRCDITTSLCTSPLNVGSACPNATQICVSYASCDGTSGTCVARPVVGAACNATTGPQCLGGSCDTTSGTCMLMPTAGACS